MSTILIQNVQILTMKDSCIFHGNILIQDDKISKIGDFVLEDFDNILVIDGAGKLAMPGLINTHTHASMTLLRSYADDMELMSWLNDAIWPAEDKMNEEHIYWGALLAIVEMIRSGTTTFADMYGPNMEKVAQAVEESGIRANLCRGCVGVADPNKIKIKENETLFLDWNNKADGRIKVWFGPHAPYTCSQEYIKELVDLAEKYQSGIHIHVAETQSENEQILAEYGVRPVAYLNQLGVFDVPCLAAHSVWLNEDEIKLFAEKQVGVAHNAVSNMKLASGVADIIGMQNYGCNVGLGTDGASSNNSLNMWKDLQTAALLQKVNRLDPTAMPAFDALKAATINGAKVLRWDDEIGTLEVGKKADLILVDISAPHYCPWHNTVSDLVYSAQASDVTHTIVNGKILMKDRQITTLDVKKIMTKAQELAQTLK